MKRWIKRVLWIGVPLALIAWGVWSYFGHNAGAAESPFRTANVRHGELLVTIGATGTVEPEEVVDVGAQVAGEILEFGKDSAGKTIDYGSVVDKGTVLAKIDESTYQADVTQQQAALEQAEAGVAKAQADLGQMKAKLDQANRDWERAQKLGPSDALAESTYDAYKATYDGAKANVGVGEAAITEAKAAVTQAQAQLDRVKRNLSYCTIISPVNGVIIDRRVNIGQTVVSSLNTPSLFLIAKDLKRMQVWASVNEADIGSLHEGQPVTFTVDAFPGRTFVGSVNKVRLNATMTQNVVTYTVEVTVDNSDMKLLPYLTASLQFEIARHENVMLVPNSALRWAPTLASQVVPEARDEFNNGTVASSVSTTSPVQATGGMKRHGTVWVAEGNLARPIQLHVGQTDGTNTEVSSDALTDDSAVIVGDAEVKDSASTDTTNPFMPKFPSHQRQSPTPSKNAPATNGPTTNSAK